jgi:phenylpropionate dioxygenase-like ring-hydroxylating dioxygenase large terminal subunit
MIDAVLLNDWHPVIQAESLKPGQLMQVRLLKENVVLWRVGEKVVAWEDLCPHRGTPLSMGRVENDTLVCGYHGWTYDAAGQCVRFPAHPRQVAPRHVRVNKVYQVQERYGLLWVCMGNPDRDIPTFAEWGDASYRKVFCGPYPCKASGTRFMENFLDVAHFPYVHEGYLGDPQHAEIEKYEIVVGPEGITADDIRVWQPNPDGLGQGATVAYTYSIYRPFTGYLKKTTGQNFVIYFTITPVEEAVCVGWMWLAMNYGFDTPAEEIRAFEDLIVAQDLPVVEAQRPELLPLDLQAELHHRSDALAIAYRKHLKDLGLTFGTV